MHAEKGGEGRPIIRTKADLFISFIIPVTRADLCLGVDTLTRLQLLDGIGWNDMFMDLYIYTIPSLSLAQPIFHLTQARIMAILFEEIRFDSRRRSV